MSMDLSGLHDLSVTEKLRIVEMLWDDLGAASEPIPLPDWADREAARRRSEMQDATVGLTHEQVWRRIEQRNG